MAEDGFRLLLAISEGFGVGEVDLELSLNRADISVGEGLHKENQQDPSIGAAFIILVAD